MNKCKQIYSVLIATTLAAPANTSATTLRTDWTEITPGDPGAATGKSGSISVSYTGQVISTTVTNGTSPIWYPESTYVGGASDTSPDSVGDHIGLSGSPNVATIRFSSPVTDPVFAIWSLGQPGLAASFTFDDTPLLQVGGQIVSMADLS